jgi:GNAT superfamily N-acetyltransferase
MEIVKATAADLAAVLGWLEREFEQDSEGFWCNRRVIDAALEHGDLWVIRRDDEPVAVQVGDYAPSIVSVRKDCRRQGLGDAMFAASLQRAIDDNVNVLSIECSPRSSWPFWQRHGFERFGDLSEWGTITARRILPRSFDIPADLPSADVTIGFYPEAATYGRGEVKAIASHRLCGGRLDDGAILLERRVIGLTDDEPEGKNLVVKIEVDGEDRCFCKAKYEEAEDAGVTHDWRGGAYYIDAIEPADG